MKNIAQFTLSEWFKLAPLSFYLKQLRNDIWQSLYLRNNATGQKEMILSLKAQRGKCISAIVAFEQPWALGWFLKMAQTNLPDVALAVFDNSINEEKREEIKKQCALFSVPYLALPLNRTKHPNRSHGMAMNWIYQKIIKPVEPSSFGFIDHDMIPLQPLEIMPRLGTQPFYGMLYGGGTEAWQLWAGYCFYRYVDVCHLKLNFLYDFSLGLDTGGRNYPLLYKNTKRSDIVFPTEEYISVVLGNSGEINEIQWIDGAWMHIGGISYNNNFRSKAQFCKLLSEKLDSGVPWNSLRLANARCKPANVAGVS